MTKKKHPQGVALSDDLHKKIKIRAAKAGISVRSLVKTALVMYLTATKK